MTRVGIIDPITGTPVRVDGANDAGAMRVNLATDGTVIGGVTETAPATDTASSGLNGRLQRIAQRLTSLIAVFDNPISVSQPGLSGGVLQSVTTVGTSAVPVPATALTDRAAMIVQNVGATTIYLGSGTVTADTASTGGVRLLPGQSLPMSLNESSVLSAISSAAGGLVACIEVAA